MVYQMAKEFATRRYQLTINNPKEHGYDHDTIKAILAKGAKLLYWCMCDEEGKEETYHTHTTGRDKEGKAAISVITNKLLAIGRLGRALGIHLLVATQRPDVGSVPGSLKAQLDGRICGHTADAQSSIVILDDGSAANLPAIPGRFIIRNGSETDDIVQAYYYHK